MVNILIYIVSTLLTYVLGLLAKKRKWNEQLPIPVQNILVGILVFALALLFTDETNPQELLNQIVVALGGAGTATLGYDASKINKGD